ncbi:polysaccharide biosynthesis protein [Falsihalocynthiibacter arcticus]|uniref:polysaccharide biosynthesis protein n=1 Tax=Falsihalocynthiibacter arcticus TaxID=1579316 RepID=UPI000AD6C8BD|nr:nucleoside-diphosphate sugar epimerase/dehydratase [Falsihalocynthiibacter arcticus]
MSLLGRIEKLTRAQKRFVFLFVDTSLLPVALGFTLLVQSTPTEPFGSNTSIIAQTVILICLAALFTTYLKIPNIRLRDYEIRAAGKTVQLSILLSLAFMATGKLFGLQYPLGTIMVFGNSYLLFAVTSRVMMLKILEMIYLAGHPRERLIIYGAGQTGMNFAKAIQSKEHYEILSYADDNPAIQSVAIDGIPIARPSQIPHIAKIKQAHKVILAMPSLSFARQVAIVRRFEKFGLEVLTPSDFAELIGDEEMGQVFSLSDHQQLLGRAKVDHKVTEFGDNYRGKNILVTGAGGTIGSELCRQLLSCGPKQIILLDSSEFALYNADMDISSFANELGIEVKPVLGSVSDPRLVASVFAENKIDVVFHAAAYKHVPMVEINSLAGLENNVLGTATLAKASHDANAERFILVSSDKAVRPTNVMGASKRMAELVVQDQASRSNTVFSMVRFGNVLGSSGSVVPLFRNQIAHGGPVTVTHSEVTRYFMTVQEASRLVLMAGTFAQGGEVYVLDMGEPVEILNLARRMIEASGCTVKTAENPDGDIEILTTGLRQGEKMHEELLLGEGNITTPHAKIFCAREESLSELEVAAALKALRHAIATTDRNAALDILYGCVEGYAEAASPPAVEM